jgi:hypothetical protein
MAEKFELHKDKIQKTSIHDKGSIMACTEEKMGMFKQKYGLMNEKELNEVYAKEVVEWLQTEAKFQDEQQRILDEEKNNHKRKILLIEDELKLRESDLTPKTEKQEHMWNKNKHLRNKILAADRESKSDRVNISMEQMASRKRTKEDFDEEEQNERNKVEARKKVKSEIILLQSTGKNDKELDADHPKPADQNDQRYDDQKHGSHRLNIDMSIDGEIKNVKNHDNERGLNSTKINQLMLEDDEDDHLVLEKKKVVSSETMKKLEKATEVNKFNEQNMEQALIKLAHKDQNSRKQNEAGPPK